MRILANLDCEAQWTGTVLPAAVRQRLGAAAVLLAALPDATLDAALDRARAPMPVHELVAPAAIDRSAISAAPGWTPPIVRAGSLGLHAAGGTAAAGVAAPSDLMWAQPSARAANDRRLVFATPFAPDAGLIVHSLAELDAHLAAGAADAGHDGRWVVKAAITSAGRDRWHGRGTALTADARTRIARLIERAGAAVFEPWLDRLADLGVCARLAADGSTRAAPPHTLWSDARGGFAGIDLAPPPLDAADRATLDRAVVAAAEALATAGYHGSFAIDAFAYRDRHGAARLRPLCEINARYTFGWVARGLARRLGTRTLGFGAPPAGAHVLVSTAAVTAWAA
jgi:hypothetical protein